MKKIYNFFFLILSSLIIPTTLSSCSSDNSFYMANYESYISDDLLTGLENGSYSSNIISGSTEKNIPINNFNYRTYSTNEDLERNFTTNYDVAVPSDYLAAKYANDGKLLPLDWSKFNLYKLDKYGNRTNQKIKSAADALTLFTPHVREELQSYDLTQAFKNNNISQADQAAGLLNYCVPYFAQDIVMGYNSTSDWGLSNNSTDWQSMMNTLYSKINDGSVKRASVVDDYATLYSVSRLIETNNQTVNAGSPIPNTAGSTPYKGSLSIDQATQTFKKMFQKPSVKNAFLFNSDSNILLNDFAQNGSQALVAYNGDLLYAMQGGDLYSYSTDNSVFENWIVNQFSGEGNNTFNFKLARPEKNLTVLDCLVINKERVTKKNHIDQAYAVIKKIGLEGSDQSLYKSESRDGYSDGDFPEIAKTDEDDNYVYGPTINFDYTNYSSPLLTLNAYIMNSSSDENLYKVANSVLYETNSSLGTLQDSLSYCLKGDGYFTSALSFVKDDYTLTITQYNNYIQALVNVYNITESVNANYVTRNLSDLVKDNIAWAWLNVKNSL